MLSKEKCEICGKQIPYEEYFENGGCCDECYEDVHLEHDIEDW